MPLNKFELWIFYDDYGILDGHALSDVLHDIALQSFHGKGGHP